MVCSQRACVRRLCLACAGVALLAGCAARVLQPGTVAWDSALPAPSAVVKHTRAAEVRLLPALSYLHNDADYFQRMVDEDQTQQAVFQAEYQQPGSHGLSGLAYCMYQFTLPDHGAQPMLRWQWMGAEPAVGTLWIGLPDRVHDAWEWHCAGAESLLDLSAWTPYLDGDELLVLLAVADQGEFRLDWVKAGGYAVQAQVLEELEFGVCWTSAAVVGEYPAIAYVDSYNSTLKYIKANDYYGFSWGVPITVAGGANASCSLAQVNGRPAIAFDSYTHPGLAYAYAANAQGSAWNEPVQVTTANDSGNYGSLAVVQGRPAATSMTNWGYDLLYTRANDASGGFWEGSVTADADGNAGEYSSLAVVDGRPAVAYIAGSAIRYVRASDATGASWGAPLTVASGSFPSGASLAVVNDRPAISYFAGVRLSYVVANDAQGNSWQAEQELTLDGTWQDNTSLAEIGSFPAIAYGLGYASYDLYYMKASDLYGFGWGSPRLVDSAGDVGEYASLFEVQGQAGFAYGEHTNTGRRSLKYALLVE